MSYEKLEDERNDSLFLAVKTLNICGACRAMTAVMHDNLHNALISHILQVRASNCLLDS